MLKDLGESKCFSVPFCLSETTVLGAAEESIDKQVGCTKGVSDEMNRTCYKGGVQLYGIFVDDEGMLRRRYVGNDGAGNANVVEAYVEGTDGCHRRGKHSTCHAFCHRTSVTVYDSLIRTG
jgi:hypothetical protein